MAALNNKYGWAWFHRFASPPYLYRVAGLLVPWFAWPAAALIAVGLYGGLWSSPPDYQQGDGFRIIYIHVPSAYLSMMGYAILAVASAVGLVWRMKLAHAVAAAAAPLGASFTFLALVTGALWGKPMWGTFWVWDARLTSELILLFLYFGFIALRRAYEDPRSGDRAAAVLALVGVVNLPIIHYSVVWWNSLHQGATVFVGQGSDIAPGMLWPLLCMIFGFTLLFAACLARSVQAEVLERERGAAWAAEVA
ncbi:MAG TPA: heme ABC transporter permease [Gammaproteobacteria bacterium]|jgi:heme exporter protein C|nr:heme ABC transporter permease [Gammaproteobacteria bacterium]